MLFPCDNSTGSAADEATHDVTKIANNKEFMVSKSQILLFNLTPSDTVP